MSDKKTKIQKVRDYLKRYKYISYSYAFSVFGIKNLPEYIRSLRAEGWVIDYEEKNGGRYHYKGDFD